MSRVGSTARDVEYDETCGRHEWSHKARTRPANPACAMSQAETVPQLSSAFLAKAFPVLASMAILVCFLMLFAHFSPAAGTEGHLYLPACNEQRLLVPFLPIF